MGLFSKVTSAFGLSGSSRPRRGDFLASGNLSFDLSQRLALADPVMAYAMMHKGGYQAGLAALEVKKGTPGAVQMGSKYYRTPSPEERGDVAMGKMTRDTERYNAALQKVSGLGGPAGALATEILAGPQARDVTKEYSDIFAKALDVSTAGQSMRLGGDVSQRAVGPVALQFQELQKQEDLRAQADWRARAGQFTGPQPGAMGIRAPVSGTFGGIYGQEAAGARAYGQTVSDLYQSQMLSRQTLGMMGLGAFGQAHGAFGGWGPTKD